MGRFLNLNERIDPLDFATWLDKRPRPSTWHPIGSTYHNTYIPNAAQWRGRASMKSMQATYEAKGWDRGPHFYLALGTSDDGIWAMTPPELEGIHAGDCNHHRFGIEVVGDFSLKPMSHAQLVLLSEAIADLHDWCGCGPDVVAHRDCMPRTCPGDAAYAQKGDISALVAFAQQRPNPPTHYTELSPILGTPLATRAQLKFVPGKKSPYAQKEVDTFFDRYWQLATETGVDPIIPIAQMLHETGDLTSFWSARPQRNPAGIGITGEAQQREPLDTKGWAYNTQRNQWERGVSFVTWADDAQPAHVGRLLQYAVLIGGETVPQRALIARSNAAKPFPPRARGSAPLLRELGWAYNPALAGWAKPGQLYGLAIAQRANRLIGASG